MKKLYIITAIIIFFTSACEEYLEVHPYDRKVVGSFYKTPQDALEGLVAAYDPLQYGYSEHFILISEIASDNCFGGAGKSDDQRLQAWDKFVLTPFSNEEPWDYNYQGIYRANMIMEKLGEVEWGEQPELEDQYMAEAKFLRAYYYFDLVRLYGNIPLLDKVITNPDELEIPQADPQDVYALIAQDLEYAIQTLEPIPYSNISPDDYGRVTKWAAEALLARVYLYYTGYYNQSDLAGEVTKDEARNYIDDVINNGGFSLVDSFKNLWAQALDNFVGEDNSETVFAIKYTHKGYGDGELYDGSRWQIMIGLRTQNIPPYATGWGAATVNPKLWNDYETDDSRKEGSIIDIDSYMYITQDDDTLTFTDADQRQHTGYVWKKFMPISVEVVNDDGTTQITSLITDLGGDDLYDNRQDYPVIRYADVLLMAAELHLNDNLGLAQQYFNMVRDRAFLDDQHRITLTNDEDGLATIREERRFELALEGHRYWDLLRADGLAGNLSIANEAIDCLEPYEVDFRSETQGLFMIPEEQITLSNNTLVQNPGWID